MASRRDGVSELANHHLLHAVQLQVKGVNVRCACAILLCGQQVNAVSESSQSRRPPKGKETRDGLQSVLDSLSSCERVGCVP